MMQTTLQPSLAPSNQSFNHTKVDIGVCLALSLPSHFICLLGLPGNGFVIWFLCFGVRRNFFTLYILNLAVADFFLLLVIFSHLLETLIYCAGVQMQWEVNVCNIFLMLFGATLSLSLLTAISVARCLSVIYPLWYKCCCPKNLSAIVCVILWLFALLCIALAFLKLPGTDILITVLWFGVITPLMIVYSLLLVICVRRNSQQRQPTRLYWAIIINVLVFIITFFPTRIVTILMHFKVTNEDIIGYIFLYYAVFFLTAINSSANPFIYFLVGKTNNTKSRAFLKEALLRVFRSDHNMPSRDDTSSTGQSRSRGIHNFLD